MPQLRVHFTDRDFARTRLRLKPDLRWEVVSSAQILQHKDGDLSFGAWRRSVRELAARDPELRTALHTVVALTPRAAYFPEMLAPLKDLSGADQRIDAVLSAEPDRRRAGIGLMRPAWGPEASRLDDFARERSAALRQLREALRVYFRAVIAPYLPTIEAGLNSDVAPWIQRYLQDGPEGLLDALGPTTRWDPPVLSVDYPLDRDLHLDGRGLVLIPCYFVLHHPVALVDPQLPPALAFPIRTESRLLAAGRAGGDHLTALLGSTRASILRSVVGGSTTTGLAKLVGVAPATVSHHTGVLREAGLITTEREENFARHLITPLGLRVLAGR